VEDFEFLVQDTGKQIFDKDGQLIDFNVSRAVNVF
jgi:hypothetical protein